MRDGRDREREYYQKIQGDMYVIHEVELFLLMSCTTIYDHHTRCLAYGGLVYKNKCPGRLPH